MSGWYNVTLSDARRGGARFFLDQFYGGSLQRALEELFPYYSWQPWRFAKVSQHFWESHSNRLRYGDWLKQTLGIRYEQDWYSVRATDVRNLGGSRFLSYYGNSLQRALEDLYPEYSWQAWRFWTCYRGFWAIEKHRQHFLLWTCEQLGIVHSEQWKRPAQAASIMGMLGGAGLLGGCYVCSLGRALVGLFPGIPFGLLDKRTSSLSMNRPHNIDSLLAALERQLCIEGPTEWPQVALWHLRNCGGRALLSKGTPFARLSQLLPHRYPEFRWASLVFLRGQVDRLEQYQNRVEYNAIDLRDSRYPIRAETYYSSDLKRLSGERYPPSAKTQLLLYRILRKALGSAHSTVSATFADLSQTAPIQILFNAALSDALSNGGEMFSSLEADNKLPSMMTFDIFVPSLLLAVEYQGIQHFQYTSFFGSPFKHQIADERKRRVCLSRGITLTEVGYWWDLNPTTLMNTILLQRPDIKPLFYDFKDNL